MGRKPRNTIQRTVNMHPSLISEVRGYAKKRTNEIIEKEELEKKSKTKNLNNYENNRKI